MIKKIVGKHQSIRKVFKHKFKIPDFQRPYSWDENNCEQLYEDLFSFIDDPTGKYFLGSIVVYPNKGQLCVIDGQQRLTTLLMLIYVFYEEEEFKKKTRTDKLAKIIYKKNSETGKMEPRVVRSNDDEVNKDRKSLRTILKLAEHKLEKGDRFEENYKLLKDRLEGWGENKSSKEIKKAIKILLDKTVMLLIRCGNEDDALNLFEIINDRGMPLNDADIFKTRMYSVINEEEKEKFIDRWDRMDNHLSLFRSYMHIHRAEQEDIGKEKALKEYILKECIEPLEGMKNKKEEKELSEHFEEIMINLEKCNWLEKNKLSDKDSSGLNKKEKVYWKILENYPNSYCLNPLKVFLCKHADYDSKNDMLYLDEDKREIYMELIKDTTRYFLFKGLVYKDVRKVREISYKVCARIADEIDDEKDYMDKYRAIYEVDSNEKEIFWEQLDSSVWGIYARCLILLSAFLNDKQKNEKVEDYITFLEGEHSIEHIFPRKGDTSVLQEPDKRWYWFHNIGNLVPIEGKINTSAGNKPFPEKKKTYKEKESKVQDVIDLSNDPDERWDDTKITDRQEKIRDRFKHFFGPMYFLIKAKQGVS